MTGYFITLGVCVIFCKCYSKQAIYLQHRSFLQTVVYNNVVTIAACSQFYRVNLAVFFLMIQSKSPASLLLTIFT
jgi:hypothetical protein